MNNVPAKRREAHRPPGLTPAIQQIIVDTIKAGNYQKVAAETAGVSKRTLLEWRERGRRGVEPYASLEKAIEQANRDCEMALVEKVMGATDEDWRAAAYMLGIKYPKRWSRERERAAFGHSYGDANVQIGGLNISIQVADEKWRKNWNESVEKRRLEMEQRRPAIDVTPETAE